MSRIVTWVFGFVFSGEERKWWVRPRPMPDAPPVMMMDFGRGIVGRRLEGRVFSCIEYGVWSMNWCEGEM